MQTSFSDQYAWRSVPLLRMLVLFSRVEPLQVLCVRALVLVSNANTAVSVASCSSRMLTSELCKH